MIKKILLPVDGSGTCQKTYDMSKEMADKFNAEIVLFNAQEISATFVMSDTPIMVKNTEYDPEEIAKKIVDNAASYYNTAPELKVSTAVAIGDPASEIINYADENDIDLIIMCTHGMSAVKRFLLGSITNKVVHHANVPVIVVR